MRHRARGIWCGLRRKGPVGGWRGFLKFRRTGRGATARTWLKEGTARCSFVMTISSSGVCGSQVTLCSAPFTVNRNAVWGESIIASSQRLRRTDYLVDKSRRLR